MAQIMSDTPGRLRVRVRRDRRHQGFMEHLRTGIDGRDGIDGVRTNAATGSVTVRYDWQQLDGSDVLALLSDLGVVAGQLVEGPEAELPSGDTSTAAAGIMGSLDDLDRRLSKLTGRTVDLKLLFPLGLGAIGVYKLLNDGFQFEELPAYVLLWYAFDSFYKLHTVRAAVVADVKPAPRARGSRPRNGREAAQRA